MTGRQTRQDDSGAGAQDAVHAVLFDADGTDRELRFDDIDLQDLGERQLLWADLQCGDPASYASRLRRLGLDVDDADLGNHEGRPRLQNFGDWFLLRAIAIAPGASQRFHGQPLTVVTGRNFVITLHREPLPFLSDLRDRERGETQLGILSAESFTTSVLDWLLTTYFDAIAELEAAVDRLELQVFGRRMSEEHLPDLAALRRAASRLRRLLAPHRSVFGSMARPDFRPAEDGDADPRFQALNDRFERSLEAVENARELVVGSFELFATRTAQRTNETMRVLTFVTVLLGTLAVLAGVLGMNFSTPFFETGTLGFAIAVGGMVGLTVIAVVIARLRRWL